jgi:hypothetical protein
MFGHVRLIAFSDKIKGEGEMRPSRQKKKGSMGNREKVLDEIFELALENDMNYFG